ncbi:unnamed protein product [Rotaria sp. Silwood1]|nr:unnamed protein product [Rotaria sp. Silwood1]
MASNLTRTFLYSSRVVQTTCVRTLASQQGKGPMDYVKQGVDQLNQEAGKVKEAVSNATSTVVDAVSGDNNANRNMNDGKKIGQVNTNTMKHAVSKTTNRSVYETSSSSSTNSTPLSSYSGSSPASQSSNTYGSSSGNKSSPASQPSGSYGSSAPYTSDSPTEPSGGYNRSSSSASDKIRDQGSDYSKQAKPNVNQTGSKGR